MKQEIKLKILFIILIIIPMVNSNIKNVLFVLVIALGAYGVIQSLKKRNLVLTFKKEDISGRIFIGVLLLFGYSVFNIILNGVNYIVFERLIQLIACLIVLLFVAEYEWTKKDYNFCIAIIRIVIIICILLWGASGLETNTYKAMFTTGNALGAALFSYMGIYLAIPRKYSYIDKLIILFGIILMYFANSRSCLGALLIFIVLRYLFTRKKWIKKNWLFYTCIILFSLFPILYVWLYNSNYRIVINDFSRRYFRKNFFSGRQNIWDGLFELIKQNILIGYGFDGNPEKLLGVSLSSHNWYVQILLQMGIIGYIFMINILRAIWKTLNSLKDSFISLSTCAFFIGVLFWQCFEVAITQNNIPVGILIWFILGMGINNNLIKLCEENKSK